jgi:hypothetical protein
MTTTTIDGDWRIKQLVTQSGGKNVSKVPSNERDIVLLLDKIAELQLVIEEKDRVIKALKGGGYSVRQKETTDLSLSCCNRD